MVGSASPLFSPQVLPCLKCTIRERGANAATVEARDAKRRARMLGLLGSLSALYGEIYRTLILHEVELKETYCMHEREANFLRTFAKLKIQGVGSL